ncbi:hypothetical protein F6Y05_33695 (plasmid) [Bacillus megaterium]|nr:hypothetical protein [Priestia megaterium]
MEAVFGKPLSNEKIREGVKMVLSHANITSNDKDLIELKLDKYWRQSKNGKFLLITFISAGYSQSNTYLGIRRALLL